MVFCLFQEYNKCIAHFTVNDVKFAQQSVDKRMKHEMKKGNDALRGSRGIDRVLGVIEVDIQARSDLKVCLNVLLLRVPHTFFKSIKANSGGPFGSAHLAEIQMASESIHRNIFNDSSSLPSWYKAEIRIEGHDEQPWTVSANVKNCTV